MFASEWADELLIVLLVSMQNGSFIVVSSRKVNGFLLISTLAARFASFQAEVVRLSPCRSQRERQTLRRFEWKDQWISVGLDVD